MYILLILWSIIDIIFLVALLFRKHIAKSQNEIWQRSIERGKRLSEKLPDILLRSYLLILLCSFTYIIISNIPDIYIQKLLEWYKGIFFATLFPVLLSWFKDKNLDISLVWMVIFIGLVIFLVIAEILMDSENLELIVQYRDIWNILITMFVVTFLNAVFGRRKESDKYYAPKLLKKGIRKDLHYRTPDLMVNVSDVELVKYCEKYFDEYICKYKKLRDLQAIEYVNLAGIHRKLWYEKAARFMKIFVAASISIIIICMIVGMSYEQFVVIGLILVFGTLITVYKHIDLECLYEIGIRYAYDQWGYYLTYTNGSKFVGNVQIIAVSKFHKYVYSFLDIASLCRMVAFNDRMSGENRICIITKNLSELFLDYTDYKDIKNWIMIIPLWIGALFEFYVTGGVTAEVKATLLMSAEKSKRADLSIFLQSFWADMERKKLDNEILDYLRLFEAELYV